MRRAKAITEPLGFTPGAQQSRLASQVYNIGTDRFGTMREALEALCRHASTGSKVKSVPDAPVQWVMAAAGRLGMSPVGAYHDVAYGKPNYFDVPDAVNELGWHPAGPTRRC